MQTTLNLKLIITMPWKMGSLLFLRFNQKTILYLFLLSTNAFNIFFTTIVSNSNASKIECANFFFHHFRVIKNNFLQTKTEFNFTEINNDITGANLSEISADSSPGISNIPCKILLLARSKLIPILTTLFNECIKLSYIPFDWKCAVVTPLFKNNQIKIRSK
jgi:hypothetical protein